MPVNLYSPPMKRLSVKDCGALGDGLADDAPAFQRALDSGATTIRVPRGTYRIASTLRVRSGTTLVAAADARVFSCGETPKRRGDFLLTNAEDPHGCRDITLRGGIWDGNNPGRCNTKPSDLFDPDAWSGVVLNFDGVRNLRLENLTVANSVTYNIRLCRIDGFSFRHIRFQSDRIAFNQDGLHFAGCCRNGRVFDVQAISKGQTNDDLVALNADDSLVRLENRDLVCGPIENIVFTRLRAEDCHTIIRLLSVNSTIRNIRFRDVEAGCREFAVNADAARYCRTPLFRDEDHPGGVGYLDNIRFDGLRVHATRAEGPPLICIESNAAGFQIRGFARDRVRDARPDVPTLRVRHVREGTRVLETEEAVDIQAPKDARARTRFPSRVLLEKGLFEVTSPYGYRTHPVTGEADSFHAGVDGALWDGRMLVETGICAWEHGTVLEAEDSDGHAGTFVTIRHAGGLVSSYCHLERGSLRVAPGAQVARGGLLGWMGQTGRATGAHLHFEMKKDGNPVDPVPFLKELA